MLNHENLCRMPKTIRELGEEMAKAVLREYNSVANIRVSTESGPGFVMLDGNRGEAVARALKAGVAWLLRYETTMIHEASPPIRRQK